MSGQSTGSGAPPAPEPPPVPAPPPELPPLELPPLELPPGFEPALPFCARNRHQQHLGRPIFRPLPEEGFTRLQVVNMCGSDPLGTMLCKGLQG